jgi:hypothetical protein
MVVFVLMEQLVYVVFEVNGPELIVLKVCISKSIGFDYSFIVLGRCSGNYNCLNGGSCSKNVTVRACICPPSFRGTKCEIPIKD